MGWHLSCRVTKGCFEICGWLQMSSVGVSLAVRACGQTGAACDESRRGVGVDLFPSVWWAYNRVCLEHCRGVGW